LRHSRQNESVSKLSGRAVPTGGSEISIWLLSVHLHDRVAEAEVGDGVLVRKLAAKEFGECLHFKFVDLVEVEPRAATWDDVCMARVGRRFALQLFLLLSLSVGFAVVFRRCVFRVFKGAYIIFTDGRIYDLERIVALFGALGLKMAAALTLFVVRWSEAVGIALGFIKLIQIAVLVQTQTNGDRAASVAACARLKLLSAPLTRNHRYNESAKKISNYKQ